MATFNINRKCDCDKKRLDKETEWLCANVPIFLEACKEKDFPRLDSIRAEIASIMEELPEDFKYKMPEVNFDEVPDHELIDHITVALNKRGFYANAGKNNLEERASGLGDSISKVLSAFGITEERFSNLFNIGGCNCDGRKEFLNKILPYKEDPKKKKKKK